MPAYGFTLFSELNGPNAMLDQAAAAEAGDVDFLAMSDHFHPWLSRHTDSPFAWSALGAVAARTERVELVTLVTCPFMRYHPTIVAQASATIQLISEGRFTLGLGAGENLSEHVIGARWPAVDVRHRMFAEAVEIIRALWGGDWVTYRGEHLTAEDAKLFTLPDTPPRIAMAASGPRSIRLAAEHADDVISDSPDEKVVDGFRQVNPDGHAWTQIPIAYDESFSTALEAAHHFGFSTTGWKVQSELPNIPGFDATARLVDDEMIQQLVVTGNDPAPLVDKITQASELGYDRISVVQVGPDRTEGFQRWWSERVRPGLP